MSFYVYPLIAFVIAIYFFGLAAAYPYQRDRDPAVDGIHFSGLPECDGTTFMRDRDVTLYLASLLSLWLSIPRLREGGE